MYVVFAPRDADDRALRVRGGVQIATVDPEQNARTARWELSAAETERSYKNTPLGGDA